MECQSAAKPFFSGRRRFKLLWLLVVVAAWAVSSINPVFPAEMWLQHSATVLMLAYAVRDLRLDRRTRLSIAGLHLFALLHILGARYIYSYVPYNEWLVHVFDFDLQAAMGWQRNHYDRFAHFMYGLLLMPLFTEIFGYRYARNLAGAVFIGWLVSQTGGMLYELFEWSLTLLVDEESAANYAGQQGDIWDAQKDLAWGAGRQHGDGCVFAPQDGKTLTSALADVNFLAHYYADARPGHPVYNTALLVPDLFRNICNQNLLREVIRQSPASPVAEGIARHWTRDEWFHQLAAFRQMTTGITQDFRANLPPGPRYSFLAHLIVEMLLDHFILTEKKFRLDYLYEDMQAAREELLAPFAAFPAPLTERVARRYDGFVAHRYLRHYGELDGIATGVERLLEANSLKMAAPGTDHAAVRALVDTAYPTVQGGWQALLPPDTNF